MPKLTPQTSNPSNFHSIALQLISDRRAEEGVKLARIHLSKGRKVMIETPIPELDFDDFFEKNGF